MADDDDRNKDAKRQKLQSEQGEAYEEDMARIDSALIESAHSAADSDKDKEKNENGNQQQDEEIVPHHEPPQHEQQVKQESDDEMEGNWLKNFTPHHTRVGADYQVTDLPTPSASLPAVIVPKQ